VASSNSCFLFNCFATFSSSLRLSSSSLSVFFDALAKAVSLSLLAAAVAAASLALLFAAIVFSFGFSNFKAFFAFKATALRFLKKVW
jgi:hypothetical protein